MDDILELTQFADSDGFVTYECPYCGSVFKLDAEDVSDDDLTLNIVTPAVETDEIQDSMVISDEQGEVIDDEYDDEDEDDDELFDDSFLDDENFDDEE